jgi:hypothetical protein
MNSVNLLKVHYFSYTEAQVWVRIYTRPSLFYSFFFFPLCPHFNRLQPAVPRTQIPCAVSQQEAQLNKLSRTSLLHWGHKTWFFIKLLLLFTFLQRIIQEWRTKTSLNRIQNLKFHCRTDTSLFITRSTWLNAASSGHVSRRGKICG